MDKIRTGLAAYGMSGRVFHAPFISAINLENQGFAKLVHENVHETPQISILGAFFCG